MNELELIRRAQAGDEVAWIVLVQAHQEALFRLAYLLLGSADDAEDVAQDALIRAYRNLGRFDATRPLRPWLLQITRNLAFNQQRSARRYLAAVTRWWQQTGAGTNHQDAPDSTSADADLLWQAVRSLAQADQEVIYLRYFLELSVAETADALEVAEGTVKSRLSRALRRLRVVVEREYPTLREEVQP